MQSGHHSVPTLMHRLRARLAETLMSTGDQSCIRGARIFTVDQTHFAAVVGYPCCGFRRYCSVLWRCLIGRLCHIFVCAVVIVIGVSSKIVIQRCDVGAHAVIHGVQKLHRCIRAAVIEIDAVGDLQLVLSTFSQAFDHACIVHSRIVHPCHMVPHCPLL